MKKQTVEIKADSLAGARELLNARLGRNATMRAEQIVCDGEPRTLEGTGNPAEVLHGNPRPNGDAVFATIDRNLEILRALVDLHFRPTFVH
jgi:hypothetical protein